MKKIFTKSLSLFMAVAFAVTVIAIFTIQTILTGGSNTSQSRDKLEQVREKLQSNEAEIERLTDNLGENNLAKSRAFADLLAADPSILDNDDNLDAIMDRLMVNELHVIDKNGIITNSTVDAYIGFDMGSGEQSAAFLVITDDPSIEIVQEPQQNAAEGIVVQYVGVARKDAPGFVQVGIQPEILEETLENTAVDVVLRDIDFGEKGYIFAIDKSSGTITAHKNSALIGKTASEAGFTKKLEAGKGKVKMDGVSGHYMTEDYNDMLIGTFLPNSEYYSASLSQTLMVSISMLVIFIILLNVINRTVDRQIVSGIHSISGSMKRIADGDFSVVVDEDSNIEFRELSDSINTMVSGIKDAMSHNDELLEKQKADMEESLSLIESIKSACKDLESAASETKDGADSIEHGTEDQKTAVDELERVLQTLENELNLSADETIKVQNGTKVAVDEISLTSDKLSMLGDSISNINDISMQIEKIIEEIDAIAGQTNLLALNASIEAARAGETGRGFTVVATQVGELAARSSQAASETAQLIQRSVEAVKAGKELADNTAREFEAVVEMIQNVDTEVANIADMVRENVSIVSEAVDEIEKIETVVDANVQIAHNSKQISTDMADITGQLMTLVS